jgi:hypothetical protein
MQNVLDLNEYGVVEMRHAEVAQTEGGLIINPWTVAAGAIAMGYAASALYSFVNGVYTGIKDAMNGK